MGNRSKWVQLTPKERRQHVLQHDTQYPLDTVHPDEGLVDVWIMGDHTIICDPTLANPISDVVDTTCQDPKRGGVRSRTKTMSMCTEHKNITNNREAIGKYLALPCL